MCHTTQKGMKNTLKIFVNLPDGFRENSFITPDVKKHLEKIGEVKYNDTDKQLSGDELALALSDCDAVLTGWGQPRIYPKDLGNAKLIIHTGGTVGGIVDLSVFDTDVTVLSGNGYYADSVAEGVIAYMLFALRNLGGYQQNMKENGYWDWNIKTKGLIDKKVGIISLGAISSRMIPILHCFTDKIKVYSTHRDEERARTLGFEYADMDDIFKTCDVISVHTAKNDETYHMVNKKHFDLIQDGALFINTSRGPVIDEDALAEALKDNRFTALLDVYNKEPLPKESPLYSLPNVYLFPHMAGPTFDRREGITNSLLTDVERYMKGETPVNIVTKEVAEKMTVS